MTGQAQRRWIGSAGCLLTFLLAASAPSQAEDRAASCRRFVQEFYTTYARQTRNSGDYNTLLRKRRSSFSPELLRRLKEDEDASRKNSDEIVGLDFDPFLNAQDIADRYEAGRVRLKNGRYRVEVHGIWNGKRNDKPDVVPELLFQRGRWVFTNFHYRWVETSTEDSDLLTVLRNLRRERAKGRK